MNAPASPAPATPAMSQAQMGVDREEVLFGRGSGCVVTRGSVRCALREAVRFEGMFVETAVVGVAGMACEASVFAVLLVGRVVLASLGAALLKGEGIRKRVRSVSSVH